jgi:hypothetical protein
MRHGGRLVRSRRGCCRGCERTHVLLPAFCVPRRRDGVEVIGVALIASARGDGYRTIAARLDRPPGTVRGWVRAFARRSAVLGGCGVYWTRSLADELDSPRPTGTPAVDALSALTHAAITWTLRFGRQAPMWEVIVALCGGALLSGRPPPDSLLRRAAPAARPH